MSKIDDERADKDVFKTSITIPDPNNEINKDTIADIRYIFGSFSNMVAFKIDEVKNDLKRFGLKATKLKYKK